MLLFFKCINCLSFFIFVIKLNLSPMELINDMYGGGSKGKDCELCFI